MSFAELIQKYNSLFVTNSYSPVLARILGDVKAGIFLSFVMTKIRMQGTECVSITQYEIEFETGLTRRNQETARERLKELGVLVEEHKGVPRKIHYSINTDRLLQVIEEGLTEISKSLSNHSLAGLDKQVWRVCANKFGGFVQTGDSVNYQGVEPISTQISSQSEQEKEKKEEKERTKEKEEKREKESFIKQESNYYINQPSNQSSKEIFLIEPYHTQIVMLLQQLGFMRKSLRSEDDRRELREILAKCDGDIDLMIIKLNRLVKERAFRLLLHRNNQIKLSKLRENWDELTVDVDIQDMKGWSLDKLAIHCIKNSLNNAQITILVKAYLYQNGHKVEDFAKFMESFHKRINRLYYGTSNRTFSADNKPILSTNNGEINYAEIIKRFPS